MGAVDYLAGTDTVHIVTGLPDGREVVTRIWAVVVDGVPYVRNGFGERSQWYARVRRAGGRAAFLDGDSRYAVTLAPLDDADVNTRVDAAYRDKYASAGDALREAVSPEVRANTLRVTVTAE
ncbi:DUF2255 family protein [Streptomyces sp. NBC_01497]|uniref:DUF2255 family protein n=1 Tax=Streptomyces sp. NBC_01497 TaxID=2903885 RepID=UPI002E35DB94|nr:DUF2255 family protein [Streptomyces sp. NBC_01497]